MPLFSTALVFEYEDLLNRNDIWTTATTYSERRKIFRALIACGQFVTIYYRWRPNLQDEGDNFLLELAIAGNAEAIITFNKQDFYQGQLVWPFLRVMTPAECLEGLE